MDTTSGSLLERLRDPREKEAWDRFARLYTPLLFYWLRRLSLPENDAADLIQEIFLILLAQLPRFEYRKDGTFRGWLRTITLNKHREWQRRQRMVTVAEPLDVAAAEPDVLDQAEYQRQLLQQMLLILKDEFPPSTWQYFQLYVIEGRDPQEIADQFQVSVGTIYTAKSKVLARLREELKGLMD